jgi:alpha-D-ribose 1-methylphosphonate 5-triphosphate synthase subunit PhnL
MTLPKLNSPLRMRNARRGRGFLRMIGVFHDETVRHSVATRTLSIEPATISDTALINES